MYRPRQPERSEPPRTAAFNRDFDRDREAGRGSLLNARTARPEGPRPGPETARRTPGSLLGATAAAVTARPMQPVEPARSSSFLPGLAAIDTLGIDDFIAWLRDGWKWIVAAVVVCTSAALIYSMVATPRFTVYTDIVIDPANLNVVSDDVFINSPQRDAQTMEVESKMRVLTSRNVLARVITDLRLTEDSEFVGLGAMDVIKALIGLGPDRSDGTSEETSREIAAMRALSERVDARREDRSFVVTLEVWSEEPAKSVEISNAVVAAFEQELFRSAAESAGRVADTMKERLDELRANVTQAERQVEAFRRANGLQSSVNGELVSNQLSVELNAQVLEAQQRLIQAQSRFNQMNAAIARGQTASSTVFDSETMNGLRDQRNRLQQQVGSIERTYGPRHPRMISAVSERNTLDGAIDREARRILELARADLVREQASFDAMNRKAAEEKANVFTDNAAQVQLRDLEREAAARAAIYETYLARVQQVGERQQIDASNVRVISHAVPPKARDWPPRKIVLLAGGAIGGLMLGIALAVWFGLWRFMRTPHDGNGRRRLAAAAA